MRSPLRRRAPCSAALEAHPRDPEGAPCPRRSSSQGEPGGSLQTRTDHSSAAWWERWRPIPGALGWRGRAGLAHSEDSGSHPFWPPLGPAFPFWLRSFLTLPVFSDPRAAGFSGGGLSGLWPRLSLGGAHGAEPRGGS